MSRSSLEKTTAVESDYTIPPELGIRRNSLDDTPRFDSRKSPIPTKDSPVTLPKAHNVLTKALNDLKNNDQPNRRSLETDMIATQPPFFGRDPAKQFNRKQHPSWLAPRDYSAQPRNMGFSNNVSGFGFNPPVQNAAPNNDFWGKEFQESPKNILQNKLQRDGESLVRMAGLLGAAPSFPQKNNKSFSPTAQTFKTKPQTFSTTPQTYSPTPQTYSTTPQTFSPSAQHQLNKTFNPSPPFKPNKPLQSSIPSLMNMNLPPMPGLSPQAGMANDDGGFNQFSSSNLWNTSNPNSKGGSNDFKRKNDFISSTATTNLSGISRLGDQTRSSEPRDRRPDNKDRLDPRDRRGKSTFESRDRGDRHDKSPRGRNLPDLKEELKFRPRPSDQPRSSEQTRSSERSRSSDRPRSSDRLRSSDRPRSSDRRSSRRRSRSRSRSRDRKRRRDEDSKPKVVERSANALTEDKDNLMLNFYEGDECNYEDPGDPDVVLVDTQTVQLPSPCETTTSARELSPEKPFGVRQSFGLGKWLSDNKSTLSDPSSQISEKEKEPKKDKKEEPVFPEPVPSFKKANSKPLKLQPKDGELYAITLDLKNKNPISALYNYSNRRDFEHPIFKEIAVMSDWRFDVIVGSSTFTCPVIKHKKKEAKNEAAKFVLRELGLLD